METADKTTEARELLPFWYVLPDGFRQIDLEGDWEERFDEVYDMLAALHPSATNEQLVSAALSFEVTVATLIEQGAVHLSSFALRAGEGLLAGLCRITVTDRPAGDPHLYPDSVLRSHEIADDRIEKGVVELPAGLAAVIIQEQEVTTPGVVFGVAQDIVSHVRDVTFQIAFPDEPKAVSISLSTEDTEHGDEFLELATVMAGGITFQAPPVPRSEEEIRAAERIHADIRNTFG